MGPYQKLDDLLVAAICAGANNFAAIQSVQAVSCEVELIVGAHGGEGFRYVDRRLQELRRAGRITFSRQAGWVDNKRDAE